jgi:hypothetical protein
VSARWSSRFASRLSHAQPLKRNASGRGAALTNDLLVKGKLHSRQSLATDHNGPEVAGPDLASGCHDDMNVRVLGVAMDSRDPGRRSSGVSTDLSHRGACQTLEV